MFQDLIDSLPIPGEFIAFALLALVLYELGFRFGRWWQSRTPEEKEGPTGMLVGSLLALMAFLLITLVIDIERPQGGSLTVSQVPLVQLEEQIGPPTP